MRWPRSRASAAIRRGPVGFGDGQPDIALEPRDAHGRTARYVVDHRTVGHDGATVTTDMSPELLNPPQRTSRDEDHGHASLISSSQRGRCPSADLLGTTWNQCPVEVGRNQHPRRVDAQSGVAGTRSRNHRRCATPVAATPLSAVLSTLPTAPVVVRCRRRPTSSRATRPLGRWRRSHQAVDRAPVAGRRRTNVL